MRIAEGYLSPSNVKEPAKPLAAENLLKQQLAKAQQGMQLVGGRPSRAAAWMNFTGHVVQHRALKLRARSRSLDLPFSKTLQHPSDAISCCCFACMPAAPSSWASPRNAGGFRQRERPKAG